MARTRASLSHKRGVKPPSRPVLNAPHRGPGPQARIARGATPPARTCADLSHKRGVEPPSRLPPRSVLNGPHRGPGPQARIARSATPHGADVRQRFAQARRKPPLRGAKKGSLALPFCERKVGLTWCGETATIETELHFQSPHSRKEGNNYGRNPALSGTALQPGAGRLHPRIDLPAL